MDGLKMVYSRRSIRKFSSKLIDEDIISKIVKAGKLAATANNVQPWEIVVIKDNNVKEQIAQKTDYGKFIKNAPLCIAVFCEDIKYYLEDGSAATQNILLAARYFDIASCWIAGDKKPYAETIREICNVKKGYKLISLIAAGYPLNNDVFKEKKIKNSEFTII
jgi:nitroreductase